MPETIPDDHSFDTLFTDKFFSAPPIKSNSAIIDFPLPTSAKTLALFFNAIEAGKECDLYSTPSLPSNISDEMYKDTYIFTLGYDLALMTDDVVPDNRKFYVRKKGDTLEYTVIDPSDQVVTGTIEKLELKKILGTQKQNVLEPFDIEKLRPYLPTILDVTAKKNHTLTTIESSILYYIDSQGKAAAASIFRFDNFRALLPTIMGTETKKHLTSKETDALKRSLNESELEGLVKGLLSAPVTVPTKLGKFLIKTALDALKEKKSGQ